jgi:hypothetical protein
MYDSDTAAAASAARAAAAAAASAARAASAAACAATACASAGDEDMWHKSSGLAEIVVVLHERTDKLGTDLHDPAMFGCCGTGARRCISVGESDDDDRDRTRHLLD